MASVTLWRFGLVAVFAGEGELGDQLGAAEDGDLAMLSDDGDVGCGVSSAHIEKVLVDPDAATVADRCGLDLYRARQGGVAGAVEGSQGVVLGGSHPVQVGLAAPGVVVLAVAVEQDLE